MPRKMSVVVTSILLSTISTASFADPQSVQGQATVNSVDYWQSEAGYDDPNGMGERRSTCAKDVCPSASGATFRNFGDFLKFMASSSK